MAPTRRTRALAALAATALWASVLLVGTARPAAAGDVGPLSDSYSMYDVQVNGSYQPIPLKLLCNQGRASIFWYGKGAAPDSLWINVIGDGGMLSYNTRSVSVNGSYKPFAGDFDGNGCSDIFWYAPGAAQDYVWYFGANLTVTSKAVSVNGTYTPIVGAWDGFADHASDIFWYAPGGARESIWTGSTSKSFRARPAPQVSGTYRPSVYGDEVILWHAPGTATDYLWMQPRYQLAAPVSQQVLKIDETYEAFTVSGRPFLYRSGPGLDRAVFGFEGTGLTTTVGNVPGGPYVVGATQEANALVFHAPGAAIDRVWLRG